MLGIQCASGPLHRVEELDKRCQGRQGDDAHEEAVHKYEESLEEQGEMAS